MEVFLTICCNIELPDSNFYINENMKLQEQIYQRYHLIEINNFFSFNEMRLKSPQYYMLVKKIKLLFKLK